MLAMIGLVRIAIVTKTIGAGMIMMTTMTANV
jgi:hypothetical protein